MNQHRTSLSTRLLQTVTYKEAMVSRGQVHRGNLILVNREHPIKHLTAPEYLLPVHGIRSARHVLEQEILLEHSCLQHLQGLLKACDALIQRYSHLLVEHRSSVYEIYYVPAEEGSTRVPVVHGDQYHLSGNNADGFIMSMGMLLIEGIVLHAYGLPRYDSMYIFLVPVAYVLFLLLLLQKKGGNGKVLREFSTWIYILHPMAIVIVRGAAKIAGLTSILVENSMIHYVAVAALSAMMSLFVVMITRLIAKKPAIQHRAWAEIRLDHITHNVMELRRVLPSDCGLMAVVKANAYGHGNIPIAKHLSRIGIRHFAVAEVEEGISLRKIGLQGEILVLGYTSPDRFRDLSRYRLSQTATSADYGKVLNDYGHKIKVHVKIDTGMSRLGERYSNLEQIHSIYQLRNVCISGTFTHLSESDSMEDQGIYFTQTQITRFLEIVDQLKDAGVKPGMLHVQNSYGILNYPELNFGLARSGIALYGLLSNESDRVHAKVDLRPVLSIKARVTLVKDMNAEEFVGYGRNYRTTSNSKIATISIGYADGVPRVLSENGGLVLIRGQRARIAGNICMDQLMADVSHIYGVQEGDVATLIGQDGEETITAGEVARRCGTITNEIVSCIGNRVERIYLNHGKTE